MFKLAWAINRICENIDLKINMHSIYSGKKVIIHVNSNLPWAVQNFN